jgi:hypothetical protein
MGPIGPTQLVFAVISTDLQQISSIQFQPFLRQSVQLFNSNSEHQIPKSVPECYHQEHVPQNETAYVLTFSKNFLI